MPGLGPERAVHRQVEEIHRPVLLEAHPAVGETIDHVLEQVPELLVGGSQRLHRGLEFRPGGAEFQGHLFHERLVAVHGLPSVAVKH